MNLLIRVLHVVHGMDCGGAENMIMNLYRNIDRKKIQFDFLVHTEKKCFFDDEIKAMGGKIFYLPYFNGINWIKYQKAADAFFENHPEYKIVHGHLGSCSHIYLQEAKKHGVFAIVHSHNTNPKEITVHNVMYRIFTLQTRRVAEYFFGCSYKAGRDRFGDKKVNGINFSVLKNAIDVKSFLFDEDIRNSMRDELNIADNFVVGHIGRFSEQKNHMFLLDIFKALTEINPNSKLILVGDGTLRHGIEKKIDKLGIKDNVILTGVRNDANKLLQAFDCFVFPSFFEGLPVTVVEAQAAGLPCIISNSITDEVCITNLIKRLSINISAEKWAEEIAEQIQKKERPITKKEIEDAGYDIKTTAQHLTAFYIEKYNAQVNKIV